MINKLIISELEKGECINELDKIEAKIYTKIQDALSDIYSMMGTKNRKISKKINMDKKVELLNIVYHLLKHITSEIHDETGAIYIKMCDVNDLDDYI